MERREAAEGSRVVVRADDGIAELALLRRGSPHGDVLELVVDGVFAMDTEQTETERALATLTLAQLGGDDLRVVVGGLGLGYTTATLLTDVRVTRVDVVELHAPLVTWIREGRIPSVAGLLDAPRVHVTVADVADAVPRLPAPAVPAPSPTVPAPAPGRPPAPSTRCCSTSTTARASSSTRPTPGCT